MTIRTLFVLVVLPALVLGATCLAPHTASATCSYNGFINSDGRCASLTYTRPYIQPFAYPLYSYNSYSIQQYIAYLQNLILQLQTQTNVSIQSSVDVVTLSAVNIEDDRATLRGRVDLNNEDKAEVYFQYGKSRTNLDRESNDRTIDEEDDDDFKIEVKDLNDDTVYYFRAVAIDDDGDRDYGAIFSFRTDESSDGEKPLVQTKIPIDVTDNSARLRGYVDMNDYKNGTVFFVYGESESQVGDVSDEYASYDDIEEDDEDLQKIELDNDLDGSVNYSRNVTNLDSNTDHYYSICVEYEDKDDDMRITCGDIESFETEK